MKCLRTGWWGWMLFGWLVGTSWCQVVIGPIEGRSFQRVPEVAVTTTSGELTVGWRTWSVTAAGGASGGGRTLAIGVYDEADGALVSLIDRWDFALATAEAPRRLTLTGLTPGTYRLGTHPRGGTNWLGAINIAGALTTAAIEVTAWDSRPSVAKPTLTLAIEATDESIASISVDGSLEGRTRAPGQYRVRWTTHDATTVQILENGVDLDRRLNGSVTFSGSSAKAPGLYVYEAVATGPGGETRAKETIHVEEPDLRLRARGLTPAGALGCATPGLTFGDSVRLVPEVVDPATVSSLSLSGPDLDARSTTEAVVVTPGRAGKLTYRLQLRGFAVLTWLVPAYATRVELTTPTGKVDVTRTNQFRATSEGSYFLTVWDEVGSSWAYSPVAVDAPPVVEYAVTVSVKPRIDAFAALPPEAPTAELRRAVEGRVAVGDSVSWGTRFTGDHATLSSEGVEVPVAAETTTLEALVAGRRSVTLTAYPRPTGRLVWSTAGSLAVEINGVRREGDHWDDAPAGRYRLRALGPDDLAAESGDVEVVVPASARSQAVLPVYPKIARLAVEQPASPRVRWTIGPAERWVNPARVTVAWAAEAAGSATVSVQGPDLTWSDESVGGVHDFILGPGVHRLALEARPLPARLRWQVQGALSASLVAPDGSARVVDPVAGDLETMTAGAHRLKVTGPDDLQTELVAEAVVIPEPQSEELTRTVDVTLTLTAGRGGEVRGAGVKDYGANVFAAAEPRRGFHWIEWQGSLRSTLTPLPVSMTEDVNLTALFAPNRYLVAASVAPAGSGTVTGEGSYDFESVALLSASPARFYQFQRWSTGELEGRLSVVVDGDSSRIALFERLQQELTLSVAGAGRGTVNHPGGRLPAGIPVDLVATPDAVSRFLGWTGDLSAAARHVRVDMERDYHLTARFEPKLEQTVTFPPPSDEEPGRSVPLVATSSSGLPVRFAWVSGPGTLTGGSLRVTGLGVIRVRAWADGDETYLPSAAVEVAFSGVAPPSVSLREVGAEVQVHDEDHAVPNRVLGGP